MRAVVDAAYAPGDVPPPSSDALAFHRALRGYAPTPVRRLARVATRRARRCAAPSALGAGARVLLIATEGVTDPEAYASALARAPKSGLSTEPS